MKWSEYPWPDWVPVKVRLEIEGFWGQGHGRGPEEWMASARRERHPLLVGEGCRVREAGARQLLVGKYVFAWNSIGRLILADGTVAVVSGTPRSLPPELPPRRRSCWKAARAARRARDVLLAAKGRSVIRAAAVKYADAEQALRYQLMVRRIGRAADSCLGAPVS